RTCPGPRPILNFQVYSRRFSSGRNSTVLELVHDSKVRRENINRENISKKVMGERLGAV
ncbi:3688_t:CDS:2, partial [Gigaspora rosea]